MQKRVMLEVSDARNVLCPINIYPLVESSKCESNMDLSDDRCLELIRYYVCMDCEEGFVLAPPASCCLLASRLNNGSHYISLTIAATVQTHSI